MKPKLFIGSSVEGLEAAYAVQQNLLHDAEAVVWPQGVFDLSSTTIESLIEVLDSVDFGVFIFTPDDKSIMRGGDLDVVRDNVLFELGLFIGKLGRKRVYVVTPSGGDLHIPSDLLGVTMGKYEAGRSDGNLQAGTGPVCSHIRNLIKRLGCIRPHDLDSGSSDGVSEEKAPKATWTACVEKGNYEEAREILKRNIEIADGLGLEKNMAYLACVEYKLSRVPNVCGLLEKVSASSPDAFCLSYFTDFLVWDKNYKGAFVLAEKALAMNNERPELYVNMARCHNFLGDVSAGIELLKNSSYLSSSKVALALSELYGNDFDERIDALGFAYANDHSDEKLACELARSLLDVNRDKEALAVLDDLVGRYPNESEYWGLLSNACLNLDLYDRSFEFCRMAQSVSPDESWLICNEGNMFINKGFYTEAIRLIRDGLSRGYNGEYGYNRLAKAIKLKDDERSLYADYCREGRSLIEEFG